MFVKVRLELYVAGNDIPVYSWKPGSDNDANHQITMRENSTARDDDEMPSLK